MSFSASRYSLFLLGIAVVLGNASRCAAVGLEKMYWSDRGANTVKRANLDGSNVETLVSGLVEIRGVAVDVQNHRIYWADNGSDKIQRSLLDGTQVEDLVTTGLSFPAGIALDVAANKMYWADATTGTLQRANLDGTGVEDIVTNLGSPYFVTLDLQNNHVYWTDYGTDKIQRADLNGSNIVDVVSTGLSLPRGVDLDLTHGKLYWADRQTDLLQRANIDGTSIEDLHHAVPSSAAPHGVAVDAQRQHVYWVDNGLVTLKRMNSDGSDVVELLGPNGGELVRPWQIVLDLRTTPATCVPGYACPPGNEDQRIDQIATAVLDGVNSAEYDYNRDGQVTDVDRGFLTRYVLNTTPGDANLDGWFNSDDLVLAFQAGVYEDGLSRNAGWRSGDWNGDLEFDSRDLVMALAASDYDVNSAAATVPEPTTALLTLTALLIVGWRRRCIIA